MTTIDDILFAPIGSASPEPRSASDLWETLVAEDKIKEIFAPDWGYRQIQNHAINLVRWFRPEIDYAIIIKTPLKVDGCPGTYCIIGTTEAEVLMKERVAFLQDFYK